MARILVTSRRTAISREISGYLSRAGHEVMVTPCTGKDAARKARRYRPDLIILDVAPSGRIGGTGVYRDIGVRLDIPIILMGVRAGENRIGRAKATGSAGRLFAPDRPARIASAVKAAIDARSVEDRPAGPDDLYRTIVENATESITIIQDGRIVYVNPRTLEMGGYTRDEMMSRPFFDFFVPEDRDAAVMEYKERLSAGTRTQPTVLRTVAKDGRIGWVEVRSVPTTWEGRPAVLSSAVDVTEKREAEEALLRQEKRHRAITENMRDTVWVLDMDFKTTFVSPSVERARGYSFEELKTHPVEKHVTPESLNAAVRAVLSALSGETKGSEKMNLPETLTLEFIRKDGTTYWSEVAITVITDEAGRPAEILGVGRDVTEKRQIEAERERLITELRDALKQVKTLSGLLPICASCKRIKDEKGNWNPIEVYIRDRSDAQFSHGICPDCARRLYPHYWEDKEQ
jgi:PAS domain S-box-containing protein